jgi:hypothetical protein
MIFSGMVDALRLPREWAIFVGCGGVGGVFLAVSEALITFL